MNKDQYFYETNSLVLAAALISVGITLDSVIKNHDGKSTFTFPRTEKFDEILESFWKKSLLVEPNSFFEAQRFLKSRIYGG